MGQHDDLVMSLAIAHYIRGQQDCTARAVGSGRQWSKRRLEEYYQADERDRLAMERRWGRPVDDEEEDEDEDE